MIGALVVGCAACGCAPPRGPAPLPDPAFLETRYRVALARREPPRWSPAATPNSAQHPAPGLQGDMLVWLELGGRRYPGVEAVVRLQHDRGFAVDVASAFGTALSAVGAGDSLLLYAPGERSVFSVRSGAGLPAGAVGLLERVWMASWRPPDAAWRTSRRAGEVRVLRWAQEGDTLQLDVDARGLPARVRWEREGVDTVEVEYVRYGYWADSFRPKQFEIRETRTALRARCRVSRWRVNRNGFVPPGVPEDARRMDWEELARRLSLVEEGTPDVDVH